ncbi:MAG: outer membrane lipoprotein carrier protein LolA [Alphaproteobacteria bacterium]|nr:MAG: outer membrane lipoprotein carrier protein LolA [Alphaproteobacteria bacterium]
MTRFLRTLLLGLSLLAWAVPASLAAPIGLDAISSYLGGIVAAEGRFTQFNADGSVDRGRIFIQRPGRIRFEYDPPSDALVIAGGGQVAIFDPKSNTPPQQFPLARTPLSIILDRKVDLAATGMVQRVYEEAGRTVVLARDPKAPERGAIALYFARDPVRLVGWEIQDEAGGVTRVVLDELQPVERLSSFLFNIPYEVERRGLN